MNLRIGVLTTFLMVSYAVVGWLQSPSPAATTLTAVELSAIPLKLEGWSGEDVPIQDQTIQVLKAQAFINRVYRDSSGRELSLHVANWTNAGSIAAAPHHPEVCYPAAGWKILERRIVHIGPSPNSFPMELILLEKGPQRVVTGHWFQVGAVSFISADGFQRQRYRFWGQQGWPDTTKFLLQTNSPSLEAASELMTHFATLVRGLQA